MRIFTPFKSFYAPHFLSEPAAHLAPVLRPKGDDVEVTEERAHELQTAAVVDPGVLLSLIHSERQGRVERKGLVLADE